MLAVMVMFYPCFSRGPIFMYIAYDMKAAENVHSRDLHANLKVETHIYIYVYNIYIYIFIKYMKII